MKRFFKIQLAAFALALAGGVSCQSSPPVQESLASDLIDLAGEAPFITKTERPHPAPVPDSVVAMLQQKKEKEETDHLGVLAEYGLRVHWRYLEHTRLARELPVESDMMLAELIRIIGIPKYTTAHEAGWLNSQFLGKFDRTGWSSYQIYVWVKEHVSAILSDDKQFPNWECIGEIMKSIDNSPLNGVGGGGVCHYGCI